MSKLKLTNYDPSKYLETLEDIADFMQDAFESNDQAVIAAAFCVVAKAMGISDIANKSEQSLSPLISAPRSEAL